MKGYLFKTDTHSMLKFLRAAKFNQSRARSMVNNIIQLGEQIPEWFLQIDTHDPKIIAILDSL